MGGQARARPPACSLAGWAPLPQDREGQGLARRPEQSPGSGSVFSPLCPVGPLAQLSAGLLVPPGSVGTPLELGPGSFLGFRPKHAPEMSAPAFRFRHEVTPALSRTCSRVGAQWGRGCWVPWGGTEGT